MSEPPAEPPATPTPNAPDMPASLPECSSTRKITPTAIGDLKDAENRVDHAAA